jgi:hypothetical protein
VPNRVLTGEANRRDRSHGRTRSLRQGPTRRDEQDRRSVWRERREHHGRRALYAQGRRLKKGKKVLQDLKYKPTTGKVLILELKHSPGELARVTKALSDAKINIELLYGSGSTYPSAQMVIGVSDLKKAEKVLGLD